MQRQSHHASFRTADRGTPVPHFALRQLFWQAISIVLLATPAPLFASPPFRVDKSATFSVELTAASPIGECSIREHCVVWHPVRQRFYLIADVVPLSNPRHPNTYDTQLHLWTSPDLAKWTYRGIAVRKGLPGVSYDGYGVASPAGAAYFKGRIYVPFSARRTAAYDHRSIGLAVSGTDPDTLPWSKTERPVSDLPGEDDDAAVVVVPGDASLHLYHRTTRTGGYRIVHSRSSDPADPAAWSPAHPVTPRPSDVRAQELTSAFVLRGRVHLLVIEHLRAGGIRIAHLVSEKPTGPFRATDPRQRYVPSEIEPPRLAFGGHITPVLKDGNLAAFFWTVRQRGARYGLLGYPAPLNKTISQRRPPAASNAGL